jgi:AbrB family looped-hinge helix DNA binding protein
MALKVSTKGWVVIPAELRRKYDLKPGTEVYVVDYGGVLGLVPAAENPLEQAEGMLRGETRLTQSLLRERKKDLKRER